MNAQWTKNHNRLDTQHEQHCGRIRYRTAAAVGPSLTFIILLSFLALSYAESQPAILFTACEDICQTRAAFSSDDSTVFVFTPWSVLQFNSQTGTHLNTLGLAFEPYPNLIAVSGSSRWGFINDGLRIIDIDTGETVAGLHSETSERIDRAAFSPGNGRYLLTCSGLGVRLWDSDSGQPIRTYILDNPTDPGKYSLAFSQAGDHVIAGRIPHGLSSPPYQNTFYVWERDSGQLLQSVQWETEGYEAFGGFLTMDFHPDGTQILTALGWEAGNGLIGPLGEVRIWSLGTGELIRWFEGARPPATFSPDGRWIVSASDVYHGNYSAVIWETATGRLVRALGKSSSLGFPSPLSVTFSRDGTKILVGQLNASELWDNRDIATGLRVFSGESGTEVHWDLGTLQFAPSVNGPWTDLPATSPFHAGTLGSYGYFRVKLEP
jgi:WD40 repeat protein